MKLNKLLPYFLLLLILILGNALRSFSYASVPLPAETADEYSFGWLGLSLFEGMPPTSWSGIAAYKSHDMQKINVDNIFTTNPDRELFPIDSPWFDHPPLFGLITGGYAYLNGVRSFADASVIILRRPMLKIALITTILIFLVASELYGTWGGLLASLVYSIVPSFVISSRLALAENGYTPLFLLAVYLALLYRKKKEIKYWLFACLAASVAVLFKLSAEAIPLFLIGFGFLYGGQHKRKLVQTAIVAAIVPLILFALYGAVFGWDTFLSVFSYNSNRFFGAGAEIFWSAVTRPLLTNSSSLTDGWLLVGWISVFILGFLEWRKSKNTSVLLLAVFSYFFVFILFGSEPYGWYRYPFYSFLAIAISYVLTLLYKKANLLLAYLLLLLPFGTIVHRLVGVEGFQQYVKLFRYLHIFILGIFILSLISDRKWITINRMIIIAMCLFVTFLSIKLVFHYDVNEWYFVT